MIEPDKIICNECGWRGHSADVLTATSPFDAEDVLRACPKCLSIDRFDRLCDEPGCTRTVSCGTPTSDAHRYRSTCGEHRPK